MESIHSHCSLLFVIFSPPATFIIAVVLCSSSINGLWYTWLLNKPSDRPHSIFRCNHVAEKNPRLRKTHDVEKTPAAILAHQGKSSVKILYTRTPPPTSTPAFANGSKWTDTALGCWPDGLELTPGFYPGSNEQHRLLQASTLNVLVRALLVLFRSVFQPSSIRGLAMHTMDVLSPFISVLCHSDWLFHGESCPRLDVVHPGRAWPSSPARTWHCSLHYLTLQATAMFPHGETSY